MTAHRMTSKAARFSLALALTGMLCGTPALYADVITGAGPGAGSSIKGTNSGNNAQKGRKDEIHIESYSWGLTSPNKPKTEGKKTQDSAAPSYPGPAVETWLGKRFPPPAPTQPALKSGASK